MVVISQTSTSIWKKQMTEGKDYIIAPDPQKTGDQNAWVVIFKERFDRVVVRYNNIQILEKGTKLSFELEPIHVPKEAEVDAEELQNHAADVLGVIIKKMHEEKTMVYVSKETGEKIVY